MKLHVGRYNDISASTSSLIISILVGIILQIAQSIYAASIQQHDTKSLVEDEISRASKNIAVQLIQRNDVNDLVNEALKAPLHTDDNLQFHHHHEQDEQQQQQQVDNGDDADVKRVERDTVVIDDADEVEGEILDEYEGDLPAGGGGDKREADQQHKGIKVWDHWGKWSACSVTCGIGKLVRWRHCVSGGCATGEKEAQIKTCTFPAC